MSEPETIKPTVQVIERIFVLLDVLARHHEPMALKTISDSAGLHPSTTHRILNDLAIGHFVDRPEAGTYRSGHETARAWQLGQRAIECA